MLRRTINALFVALLASAEACGGADEQPSAEDHRHDACVAFVSALDAEKDERNKDRAERHYDDAATSAELAASADPKYREFADALAGASSGTLRKEGDQVLLFTTCSLEQRNAEEP